MRYLDGDTLADARNAWGCGVPLAKIAGHLGVSVQELRAAMGLPEQVPVVTEPDLWAVDRLHGQL